jgi:transposase
VAKLALAQGVNTNLLFKWRRQYRVGDFGAPDRAHLPTPTRPELPAAASAINHAVTLLPVQAPAAVEADAIAASACIEVVFRHATVRICGAPEIASLRAVLDTLARRS